MLVRRLFTSCAIFVLAAAHGSHNDNEARPSSWAAYHMLEEHHMSSFDSSSFFTLHDFNGDGVWTGDEVRRFYGLDDESLKDTAASVKDTAVKDVFKIFDPTDSGKISRETFIELSRAGKQLPDFNLGPGHHGDDEYEYEIHHFEKFHDENTQVEDLIHPEDIEHFRKHEEMEREQERSDREQLQQVVLSNIPKKFRRQ